MLQHIAESARDDQKRQKRERRRKLRGDRRALVIYVAYIWSEERAAWLLLGFCKARGVMTPKKAEKLRRKLPIPNDAIVSIIDLYVAAACGAGRSPFTSNSRTV